MLCLITFFFLSHQNQHYNRHAVQKNDETLLCWFLAQGANPNFGPDPDLVNRYDESYIETYGAVLEQAANSASLAIIDILLEHGTNLQNSRPFTRRYGRTQM